MLIFSFSISSAGTNRQTELGKDLDLWSWYSRSLLVILNQNDFDDLNLWPKSNFSHDLDLNLLYEKIKIFGLNFAISQALILIFIYSDLYVERWSWFLDLWCRSIEKWSSPAAAPNWTKPRAETKLKQSWTHDGHSAPRARFSDRRIRPRGM